MVLNMSVKSCVVKGKLKEDIFCRIWDPDTSDIRTGVWALCLEKVCVKFTNTRIYEFAFCVKTNLINQTQQDKQGKVNKLFTCLGIFSCKGSTSEEILVHNVNQTWFLITEPATEIRVFIESPFTENKLSCVLPNTEFVFWFLYKRVQ